MSNDDEIERLLREVDGLTGTGAQPPAQRPEAAVPAKTSSGGSEAKFLAISAVIGVLGWVLGFLPLVNGMWLGIGGFVGALIAFNLGERLR